MRRDATRPPCVRINTDTGATGTETVGNRFMLDDTLTQKVEKKWNVEQMWNKCRCRGSSSLFV